MRTSDSLQLGDIYTRAQLRDTFNISDPNLFNGIFQPKGYDSVWIFVTRRAL